MFFTVNLDDRLLNHLPKVLEFSNLKNRSEKGCYANDFLSANFRLAIKTAVMDQTEAYSY